MTNVRRKKVAKVQKEPPEPPLESTPIKSVDDLWHSYFPVEAQKKEIANLNPVELGFLSAQQAMDKVTGLNLASTPSEISGRNAFVGYPVDVVKSGKMAYPQR